MKRCRHYDAKNPWMSNLMVYIHCVLVRRLIRYIWESERASGKVNGKKRADDFTHGIFGFQDEYGVYVRSEGGKKR